MFYIKILSWGDSKLVKKKANQKEKPKHNSDPQQMCNIHPFAISVIFSVVPLKLL